MDDVEHYQAILKKWLIKLSVVLLPVNTSVQIK